MEEMSCTRTWAALFCAARLEVDNSRLPPRFPSLPLSSPPLSPALVLIIPEPAMAGSMFWSCGLAEFDVCRFSTLSEGWPTCWTASRCSRRAVWRSMCQHHTDSSVATNKVFWLLTLICCIFLSFMISYNPHGNALAAYRSSSSPLVLRCRQKNGLRLHLLRIRINIHFTLSLYLSFSQVPQSPDSMLLEVNTPGRRNWGKKEERIRPGRAGDNSSGIRCQHDKQI